MNYLPKVFLLGCGALGIQSKHFSVYIIYIYREWWCHWHPLTVFGQFSELYWSHNANCYCTKRCNDSIQSISILANIPWLLVPTCISDLVLGSSSRILQKNHPDKFRYDWHNSVFDCKILKSSRVSPQWSVCDYILTFDNFPSRTISWLLKGGI